MHIYHITLCSIFVCLYIVLYFIFCFPLKAAVWQLKARIINYLVTERLYLFIMISTQLISNRTKTQKVKALFHNVYDIFNKITILQMYSIGTMNGIIT